MNNIKKGALVKAWSGNADSYTIGLSFKSSGNRHHVVNILTGDMLSVINIIELPSELAEQLEELGK